MIRMYVSSLKPGMKVGQAVYDDHEKLLLGKGMILDAYLIRRLRSKGVASIFIQDEDTDDVIPRDNISEYVRGSTLRHLKGMYDTLDTINRQMKNLSIFSVSEVISSSKFKYVFGDSPVLAKIRESARDIVEELINNEISLGLNSIKTYENYLYQHSIDVAIFAIMLGRRLDLDKGRLRQLGMGCLLHDMGMTFIPKTIANKSGQLTSDEFERVKLHPEIGYELTKDVAQIGVLPPHIAFQHHEKQDGSGYPRGIQGDNSLNIGHEPRKIHLYASICAVADVYDALYSDRPHRPAYQPERVLEIMVGMGGTHLNEKVLNNFLSFAPPFPVGSTVRVLTGDYQKYIGIVVRLSSKKIDRPRVRLFYDDKRKRITPIEIDLYARKDVQIESVIL